VLILVLRLVESRAGLEGPSCRAGVVDLAARFTEVERMIGHGASWLDVGAVLNLPDDRWRGHDPEKAAPALRSLWDRGSRQWAGVGVLWLGIESDGLNSFLDPVGYSTLDDTGFPVGPVWRADHLSSSDLTSFADYSRSNPRSNGYDYWAPIAWTGLLVHLLDPAPSTVTVLAGFSDGDWFTCPARGGA